MLFHALLVTLSLLPQHTVSYTFPDLYHASILELQEGLEAEFFNSVDLVKAYFARIEEVNDKGAALKAVLELNPNAIAQAEELDNERRLSGSRGPMHGIPVLLKDNIATKASDQMNTTAGSHALLGSIPPRDAGVVSRLRDAGAIFIGKAALSEWSQARGDLPSGWSGRGGQCTSAYFPHGNACGSSTGSGVAASIGLATVTLGTETSGSITCPADRNGVVGIKPSLGLTSRGGVIPITEHQDTVGPITRSVTDAAITLSLMAGPDKYDNYTFDQPLPIPDFTLALRKDALRGKRIGVPRHGFFNLPIFKHDKSLLLAFENTLDTLRELGATIVDPADLPSIDEMIRLFQSESRFIGSVDFKIDLNLYLSSLIASTNDVWSMADVIAFNDAHPELEKPKGYEGEDGLVRAQATNGRNASWYEQYATYTRLGGAEGVDAALNKHNLDALVSPANGIAYIPSAYVGYPVVTVPMGYYPDDVPPNEEDTFDLYNSRNKETKIPGREPLYYPAPGMPFGLAFLGTKWSDFDLIGMGYAFEQATQVRLNGRLAMSHAVPNTTLEDVVMERKRQERDERIGRSAKVAQHVMGFGP